jgi:hypothetical protein
LLTIVFCVDIGTSACKVFDAKVTRKTRAIRQTIEKEAISHSFLSHGLSSNNARCFSDVHINALSKHVFNMNFVESHPKALRAEDLLSCHFN